MTDSGLMMKKDIVDRNAEAIRYEQIGRVVRNLVAMMGPEIKKALGSSTGDDLVSSLIAKVNTVVVPGPTRNLTEDEIKELTRRQGGHKTCCDEE